MMKDKYSKVRSNCKPKTVNRRKIIGAICITQKSRRKVFIELDKVSLELAGGGIENCYIATQAHLHLRLGPSG